MATLQSLSQTQSEALHKLEEQLTCSICLEQYTNPKLLPCFHSFCLDCLRGVQQELTKHGNYSLPCPTCRSPCQLPQQGVDALPPSFTINNLTEVYDLLKKVTGKGHTSCDSCGNTEIDRYCQQCAKFLCQQCLQQHDKWTNNHETLGLDEVPNLPQAKPEVDLSGECTDHNKPLEIFCETCEKLVCNLCMVKKHKDHDHDVVNDAYTKHKLIIQQSSLQPLNHQIDAMAEALANLIGRRKEIAEQGENAKQVTHKSIAQIKELLDQTEGKMNKEVDRVVKYKLTVTDHQTKEGEAVLGQLTEWRDHIQQSLAVDTPHQVLSTKAQMASHTESLLATAKEKMSKPIEQANLKLVRNDKKNRIGTIKYSIATPTVTTSFDHTPIVGQESTVNLSLSLEDGSPAPVPLSLISCHLTPPTSSSPHSPVQCTVEATFQSGEYHIVFTPHTRGSHQLHVKLQDRTIDNPVSIPVSVLVTVRDKAVKIITGLKDPYGVAVSDDGQVIISERNGHCITIMTRDEKIVRSFGSHGSGRDQLGTPYNLLVTSVGTLLVIDQKNHRIQEFTMDGKCISCVGSEGNGPLQFASPCGIAINKTTGQVCVADTGNHRVQVLNADLTFSHMFGSHGSGHGHFRNPYGVAIDSQGFMYVADTYNHRIQKFTPDGQFVSSFSSKGSKPGQLTKPLYISIYNDLLYVSESDPNRRISVYTTTGDYVHCFGKGSLQYPRCFAMDTTTGYLYVCDQHCVHVF